MKLAIDFGLAPDRVDAEGNARKWEGVARLFFLSEPVRCVALVPTRMLEGTSDHAPSHWVILSSVHNTFTRGCYAFPANADGSVCLMSERLPHLFCLVQSMSQRDETRHTKVLRDAGYRMGPVSTFVQQSLDDNDFEALQVAADEAEEQARPVLAEACRQKIAAWKARREEAEEARRTS